MRANVNVVLLRVGGAGYHTIPVIRIAPDYYSLTCRAATIFMYTMCTACTVCTVHLVNASVHSIHRGTGLCLVVYLRLVW